MDFSKLWEFLKKLPLDELLDLLKLIDAETIKKFILWLIEIMIPGDQGLIDKK